MLHDFTLAGKRVRLWQKNGESYEHILLKALGFTMFVKSFPLLEIEKDVGLKYKPDLVFQDVSGIFKFWGEAGDNAIRKTKWLLKHAGVEKLVLFKIGINQAQLVKLLREEIDWRYREKERLFVVNFDSDIVRLTESKVIEKVLPEWFEKTLI
jgi:hypothetical protein